jgi:tetratricopeptide (TPR) repeat protein
MAFPYYLLAQNIQPSSIRTTVYKAVDLTYQNKDSALYIANSALAAAQKADSVQLVFVAYRTIGYIYETNSDLQKALNAYLSALKLAQLRLTTTDHLTIYIDLAIVHKKLGQYSIARDYYAKTIEQAEKIQDLEMVEDAYHGLGTLYEIVGDYEQATQHYLSQVIKI